MRELFFIIILFFNLKIHAQIATYTFVVNQSCTSCCSATVCPTFTFNCLTPPIGPFALVTPTTTTPAFTMNPCFSNLRNGNYTILVTGYSNSDQCVTCIIDILYPQQTTNLQTNKFSEIGLKVTPNPAMSNVIIDFEDFIDYKLELYDGFGRKIRSLYKGNNSIQELSVGIYYIILIQKEVIRDKKVLIISD